MELILVLLPHGWLSRLLPTILNKSYKRGAPRKERRVEISNEQILKDFHAEIHQGSFQKSLLKYSRFLTREYFIVQKQKSSKKENKSFIVNQREIKASKTLEKRYIANSFLDKQPIGELLFDHYLHFNN